MTLANVRKAIDCYYAEHGQYPGYDHTDGSPHNASFWKQLTFYTDENGRTSLTPGAPYLYGAIFA